MQPKTAAASRRTHRRGFTLTELMITVGVIGILAALVIPSFMRARVQSRTKAAVNDLRVIYDGFQQYSILFNDYSSAPAVPGVMPSYMEGLIKNTTFTNKTPLGGWYYYKSTCYGALNGRPAIGIVGQFSDPVFNRDQMTAIDKNLDDGDLTTGLFVRLNDKAFYFILE